MPDAPQPDSALPGSAKPDDGTAVDVRQQAGPQDDGAVPEGVATHPATPAPANPTAIADRFLQAMPHARALAMRAEDVGQGRATVSMPYDARLVGDLATGVVHGGVVSALMDTACGAAVLTHPSHPPTTATLDLRIDYMRPATPGQRITATAHVYHMTRSVAFVRATAHDDDAARPVATATAAFTTGA